MAKIEFTPDQKTAIDSRGCDVLVSAAAGSGKTAVLTRRVLNRIIDTSSQNSITDFLVVTFTVSAAGDLRRKLSDGIREEMKNEGANVSRLRRQLLELSYAKIATIDSFCKFIVKDCTRELGLPTQMNLADEEELAALSLEIMEECIETFYSTSEESEDFLLLAEAFSNARGDAELIPSLIKIYNHLINFPRPMQILEENVSRLERILSSRGEESVFETEVFAPLLSDIKESVGQACELLAKSAEFCALDDEAEEKYLPLIEEELEFARSLAEAINTSYECFKKTLPLIPSKRLPSIKGRSEDEELIRIKAPRTTAREIIKGLAESYRITDEGELYIQLEIHIKILREIDLVLKAFHERFTEEKKKRRIMSFSDMSHYAFSALVKEGSYNRETGEFCKTPYAEELSRSFSEILIDEYQDVNELQDLIFRAVSNSKNRFMVGDIKQSIYAFRGATPKIFEHYRDTFLPHPGSDVVTPEPKTVFLQNNYRSDGCIIDFANTVFSRLMNWESEKYLEKDKLILSKSESCAFPVELVIFDKKATDDDDEIKAETDYIARKILELVNTDGYKFEDIAILSRATASLEAIKEALDKRGIPADSTGDKNFFESWEILTLTSLLKAVANPTDDVCLASAMSSLPFSFTPDELYEIRRNLKNSSFYFALEKASEKDDALAQRCRDFISFLDSTREYASENSCDRVLWRIIEDVKLFPRLEKLSDSSSRRENVIALYEMSRSFCKGESKSLGALCEYFEALAKSPVTKTAKKQIPGAVKLMTFHASKGLQFPVCFAAGLGRLMNKRDSYEKVVFSNNGPTFDLPYTSPCTHLESYLKKCAAQGVRSALMDEELRTLYVTLTRPETRLFITAEANVQSLRNTVFSASLTKKSFAYTVKHANSHITLLAASLADCPDFTKALESEDPVCRVESPTFCTTVYNLYSEDGESDVTVLSQDIGRIEFSSEDIAFALKEIEYSKTGDVPYKISVSDIKAGLLDEGREKDGVELYSSPQFTNPVKKVSPAFAGTSMHTFMQFCSFDVSGEEECRREARRLVDEGFILQEHFDCLDFKKLSRIFDSSLMRDIRQSPRVEREKRYTLIVDAARLVGITDTQNSEKVLVQGVVDCYFENSEGGITLIDFKTDRVKGEDAESILLERHREQLTLYAEALSEILPLKVNKIFIWSFELERAIEVK